MPVYNTTKWKLKQLSDLPKVSQLVGGRAQARSHFLTQYMVQDDGPLLPLFVNVLNRLF